jgi:nickel transport protein
MERLAAGLLIVVSFAASPARAHDLWIERDAKGSTVLYGHRHSHHEGSERIEYGLEFVVRADCYDSNGERGDAGWSGETPVTLRSECAAVFVLASTGYWSKTPHGTKNLSKKDAQSPMKSWLSLESAKRIDSWSPELALPLTEEFEITPLQDPLALEVGAKARLLITLGGEPVEGATVTYDGDPRGITGKDGRANVKIRHGGFQMIQASLTVPLGTAEADETIHTTTLNFEIGDER